MRTAIRTSMILAAALLGTLIIAPGNAEELTRGALLGVSCEGCHGPGGHSPGPIPDISQKSAEYISTALEEYRSGARDSTVMGRHVRGYTVEEVALIAKYFEEQD